MIAPFTTLWGMFASAVDRHAREPLFGHKTREGWRWHNYRDFGREVNELAAGLGAIGVVRGDRVAVISDNRVEWAATAYACYRLGAAIVPMYEAQNPDDWAFITRDAGAKVLLCAGRTIYQQAAAFCDGATRVAVGVGAGHEHGYEKLLIRGRQRPLDDATTAARPEDTASILYTSGTTGAPKGVVLSHANICHNLVSVLAAIPLSSDDRSLSLLPWVHSFGHTCELHAMIALGASIALCQSVDKLADDLVEVNPTVLISVPIIFTRIHDAVNREMALRPPVIQKTFETGMQLLREQRHRKLSFSERVALRLADRLVFAAIRARFGGKLRYAFSGGAALSSDIARFIDDLGITIYEGYGLTEAGPVVSTNRPGARRLGSVGRPIAGVTVTIDHTEANDPDDGEIVVSGPSVMQGYHGLGEETARVLDGGKLRTGDIGRIDGDGYLYITGRIKEQYKLENGKYVVPGPLEEALERSPFVKRVMIHGADRPYNVALVVVNLDALHRWTEERALAFDDTAKLLASERVHSLILAEIGEHSARFKPYERIRRLVLIDGDFTTENGMLTPTLKIKRQAVMAAYGERIELRYRDA